MKTRQILTMLLCFFSTSVLAQDVIEIKVVDDKQEALPFINVAIRNKVDSTVVTGGITNESGIYRIEKDKIIPIENRMVTVSGIGFSPHTIYDLSPTKFIVVLKESREILNEVVITGKKRPMTSITSEGVLISLKDSPLSHIGSGMDLLTQLPLLSGNSESISVLGRGTPLIYINGRKVNGIQEVKQLKSSDVKSVKVITNPGALYDASVSCVLLITTYKPLDTGLGGSLYGKVSAGRKVSSDLFLSLQYRRGAFDVFGSVYNIQSDLPSEQAYTITFPSSMDKSISGDTDMRIKRSTQHYTLGLNYMPSENHSIGLKHIFSHNSRGDIHSESSTLSRTGSSSIQDRYEKDKESTGRSHNLNLYWQGRFTDNYGIKLDADVYDTSSSNDETVIQSGASENIINRYGMNSRLYAARLVNVINLWDGEFNLGVEASSTDNKQSFSSSLGIIGGGHDHLKNIAVAGFLTYSKTFGRFSSQIGLRSEFNEFHYQKDGVLQKEQSKKYHHLFPYISAVYQGWLSVQCSYRSTISRPSYNQLRSGVQYNNADMFESGNPYLKPMINHTLSLDMQRGDLMIGGAYSVVKDLIYSDISLYKGTPIALFQHKNLEESGVLRLYTSYQTKIGCWSPSVYVGYDKPFVKIGKDSFSQGVFTISQKNAFTLPYDIFFWTNYSFQSLGHYDTALLKPVHSVSLRMMKKFWDNKLSLSLDVSDLLNTSKEEYQLRMNNLHIYNHTKSDSRKISLTVTYNFNSKKNRYQGTQSTDEIKRL